MRLSMSWSGQKPSEAVRHVSTSGWVCVKDQSRRKGQGRGSDVLDGRKKKKKMRGIAVVGRDGEKRHAQLCYREGTWLEHAAHMKHDHQSDLNKTETITYITFFL